MKNVWKKAFYLMSAIYMLARLVMLTSSIDNQIVYFYKEPIAPSFFYWDLLFLIIWSVKMLRVPKRRLDKFFLLLGSTVFLLFYFTFTILYGVSHGGEEKVIQTDHISEDYVMRLGNLPGIHPGNDLHRDLFIYKKIYPMVYTKIYETNLSLGLDQVEAYRKGEAQLKKRNGNQILLLAGEEVVVIKGE